MQREGLLAFYILLPAVFIAAVLLNRSSGIYAAALSTLLLYLLLTPQGDVLLPRHYMLASAHEYFRPTDDKDHVEMRKNLEQLCVHLADALRDVRAIVVKVNAAEVYLPAEQAVPVGLIVNELVTNALKHAFPDDRPGSVEVVLTEEPELTLLVRDDGVGCIVKREGLGTRLIRLLAQQLGATVAWEKAEVGCQVRIAFSSYGSNGYAIPKWHVHISSPRVMGFLIPGVLLVLVRRRDHTR